MATHDYVLDNATGANFRADLNNALAAIVSNNSSSSEPSTKYAYQWWADTNDGVLKIRNSANDGWVTLLQLDGTLTLEDGTNSAPALGFRDDLNTGIFSSAADTLDITCGGTTRGSFSSSGLTVTGNVTATTFVGNVDAVDGDFDGTLEADAITVAGVALATVIAGTTVTTATNANHVSVADNESTNENNLIPFIEDGSATGNVGLESDGDFTYNPSTGTVTATAFVGNLTGNVTGNASGTAATVTGAAQTNITSLGTLTGLTIQGDVTFDGETAGRDVVFDRSENAIEFADNARAKFGTGLDCHVYHDGNDTFISNDTGDLIINNIGTNSDDIFIRAKDDLTIEVQSSENAIKCTGNGGVELYHNNTLALTTITNAGIKISTHAASDLVALTDGSTITVDFRTGTHFSVTLGGNRTFGDPNSTGDAIGSSGSIFITQDGTGSRTASFHADYKFAGGTAPTLSTAANAVDRLDYVVKAANVVHAVVTLDVK